MNGTLTTRRHSLWAMAAMFVVAAGMLIACVSILVTAYRTAKQEAETRSQASQAAPPLGDKEPPPKEAGFGDAFAIARTNPWFWWTLCNGVLLSGLGLMYAWKKPTSSGVEEAEQEDRLWGKLGWFAICSAVGFFTVVCLALPYTWIKSADLLNRDGWKTQEPWLVVLAYFLGLGSMFASILAVKSEERSSVGIRRWIYGYNAFLGGFLFLAIICVVNAWVALYGPEVSDWTQTNIYSLSPTTKRLVKSLDKPIRVYAILPSRYAVTVDMMNTLNNCKSLSDQLEIVELSPNQDIRELEKLIQKYDLLRDSSGGVSGVLLVQEPDSAKPLTTLLRLEDLEETTGGMMRGDPGQRFYKGEQALYTALRDFKEGKKSLTIYFTQDSGELTIDESAVRGRQDSPQARSAIGLKSRFEKSGYIVKPMKLGERDLNNPSASAIPDDALAVVVLDPLRMTTEKLAVLDGYMRRVKKEGMEPGKLIVLLDSRAGADGKIQPSGLEAFLMNYGVKVGQDVVYAITQSDPTRIQPTIINKIDGDIAESLVGLLRSSNLELSQTRTVTPVLTNVQYEAKPLLISDSERAFRLPTGVAPATWADDVLAPNPIKYAQDLINSREVLKKMGTEPPNVAVTIRDKVPAPMQQDPRMPPPPAKVGAPRAVVFGDASFASDSEATKGNEAGFNLLLTSLAWLRGKTELAVDVPPKERKSYRLNMTADSLTSALYYPVLWVLLTIIVTGIGVGILRRR